MSPDKPRTTHPGRATQATPGGESCRRRALVDDNLELVYKCAISAFRSIRGACELDDLVGFGTEGLIQAAQRFEPGRGFAFSTFAFPRIRGAIYDGIRQLSPLPSSVYRRTLGDRRLAEAGHDGVEVVPFVTSLEAHIARGYQLPAAQPSAEQAAIASELSNFMDRALARLPIRERALIRAHYYQDDTLQGAGRRLGISRSWACRLHTRALDQLRDSMGTVGLAA